MITGPQRLLRRAEAYYRTALAALDEGDRDPSFENLRTAAELAAKALLQVERVPYAKTHNIGGNLAQAGLWPDGPEGRQMSRFLSSSTHAVYGFDLDVTEDEVQVAKRLTERMLEIASRRIDGSEK